MHIDWFSPTLNRILFIFPTITYINQDTYLTNSPDKKYGTIPIVNFVWLYWAISIIINPNDVKIKKIIKKEIRRVG